MDVPLGPLRDARLRLRDAAGALSPRRRRWLRFLRDLPLDPGALAQPIESPGDRDVIVCGSSRTGTTLVAAELFRPPQVVCCMEPWDGMRLAPAPLFRSLREEMASTGRLGRGRLDIDALERDHVASWCADGEARPEVDYHDSMVVAIKWPAWWRFLDLLPNARFVVTLRHPYGTIASYRQTGGRLSEGLDYDTRFNREMNAELLKIDDVPRRRVALFDYIHQRLLPHLSRPGVCVLRYEDWFTDAAGVRRKLGSFLGADLSDARVKLEMPAGDRAVAPGDIAEERALIRRHCTTAHALGYELL